MDIENLITTQPDKADKLAEDWITFAIQHPGVSHFVFKEEFVAWAHTHGNIDTSIWVGKEIRDAYFHIRQEHEEKQMEQTGHVDSHDVPDAIAALGFLGSLFARERPKILEDDPYFKRILEEKKKAWLDKNPGKDTNSKEWLDYRYGSLENPQAPTLFSHAEEEFKTKHESLWKKYSEERKKVYDDPDQDPTLIWHQEEIDLHTQARHELLEKTDPAITIEHVQKQVETVHWEKFVEKHPEKAIVYAPKHKEIKDAVVKVEERKKQTAAQKTIPVDIPQPFVEQPQHEEHRAEDIGAFGESLGLEAIPESDWLPKNNDQEHQQTLEKPKDKIEINQHPTQTTTTTTQRPTIPQRPIFQPQPRYTTTPPLSFPFVRAPRMSSPINSGGMSQPSPTSQPPPPGGRGIGNSLLNKAGNFIPGLAKNAIKRYAALSAIVPITILLVSVAVFSLIMSDATTLEASPVETVGSTGNSITTSCQFTRAGVSQPIKSSKLLSLFQEVSQKSGIPASVLAGIAAHESQDFTFNALDSHSALINAGFTGIECKPHFPTSPTGALGFMQVQPPLRILQRARPDAYSEPGVRKGAELAGKTLESLTMQDFCDVKTSIYLGAGVLLSKNGMQAPTTSNDVEKAVCGYFGACVYTSNGSSYNYGKEVAKDFETCQNLQATNATGDKKNILTYTTQLSNALQYGKANVTGALSYNRMVQDITNGTYHSTKRTGDVKDGTGEDGIYWCTNLVIDTYNLAGITGPQISKGHQSVASLLQFWRTTPGFLFFDYLKSPEQTLKRVISGAVVFFKQTINSTSTQPFDHVAIVKQISVDVKGNGEMQTYDANTPDKILVYPIDSWNVKGNLYPLVGFGSIE